MARDWKPALRAAGIDHRRIYDLRHLRDVEPCSWRLPVRSLTADGNVAGDDRPTYGHLPPDAEDRERELLDAYDARSGMAARAGDSSSTRRARGVRPCRSLLRYG
jgi:hypothetical protein